MKRRIGLRLGLVGVAWLSFAPAAFAGGEATPFPANSLIYSAQTVASSATNQVTLPSGAIVYRFTGGAAVGDKIVFFPPTGANFIAPIPTGFVNPASGACAVGPGALAAGVLTYTVTAACPATFGTFELTLSSATITGLSVLASPGNGSLATITAQGTFAAAANGTDTSPIPVLTLTSQNTWVFSELPLSPALTINLAGTAGSTPGTQFDNGSGGISPAGFLGTFTARARQDLNAATGQPLTTAPTGTVNATVSGNFFSVTQAYLTVNPANPQASCVSPAPAAGPGTGVINATNTSITFTPPLPTTFPNPTTVWAV
jgi:hypothetical protein